MQGDEEPARLTGSNLNAFDAKIIELCKHKGTLHAVKYFKDTKGTNLRTAKEYVDKLAAANGVRGKNGGCFVATACYGSYDAPEVVALRNFRDEKLITTIPGKIFIKSYYFISPFLVSIIEHSDFIKPFIIKYLLNPIVNRLWHEKKE